MELKNENPAYRLEAEDEKVTSNNSNLKRNTSASGGYVRSLLSGNTYVIFKFEGTGIDIMKTVDNASSSAIFAIDGVQYQVGKGFTSIRGLNNGVHTVRIDKKQNGQEDFDYFDIYN